jgi:hypothetical protein
MEHKPQDVSFISKATSPECSPAAQNPVVVYIKPKLTKLGSVSELTKAGGGSRFDSVEPCSNPLICP